MAPEEHNHDLQVSQTLNVYNQNRHLYPLPTPIDQRQNLKLIEHDLNDNHSEYMPPEQHRARTYSHGSGGGYPRNQNYFPEAEHLTRPVPNIYTEEERLMRYRQMQQHRQQQQNQHMLELQHYSQHPEQYLQRRPPRPVYDGEFYTPRYINPAEYQSYNKLSPHMPLMPKNLKDTESVTKSMRNINPPMDPQGLQGTQWARQEDETMRYQDDQLLSRGFGSLDRRKFYNTQHLINTELENHPRYPGVGSGAHKNSTTVRHHSPTQVSTMFEQLTPPSSKILLRTQSLGSVETWNTHDLDGQNNQVSVAQIFFFFFKQNKLLFILLFTTACVLFVSLRLTCGANRARKSGVRRRWTRIPHPWEPFTHSPRNPV